MSAWRIRPAAFGDTQALIALEAAAFGPASWGADAVGEGLTAPFVAALVAQRDETAALTGFAFWRRLADEAEILSIGVAPDARRTGCAAALLSRLIADARREGVVRLFLEVDAGNVAAAALYRRSGFVEIGRRKRYYKTGGDALVMRLVL